MTKTKSRGFFLKRLFSLNPFSITIGSTVIVLVLYFISVPILELIDLKLYDLRFLSRGHLQPSQAVVLAVIDEKSLDTEGRWPWPRSKMAGLVEKLSQAGAKVIGFDIGFLEPEKDSLASDPALARAIKESAATVVLGYFFHMSKEGLNYQISQEEIDRQLGQIAPSRYPQVIYEDQSAAPPLISAYAPEGNLEIFTRATRNSGFFNIIPDRDGVVRWMPLIIKCGNGLFPPMFFLCAWHYLDLPPLRVRIALNGVQGIEMGKRFIKTDEKGKMLINYLGTPRTFPHFSISDILRGQVPEGAFKDKIVLVGSTAMGIYDQRNTPFSPVYPGLEIQATVIDNILKSRFLTRDNWAMACDLIAIILLGFIMGFALPRLDAVKGALFTLAVFAAYVLFARWVFVSLRTWINMAYPLLVIILSYLALTAYHYFTEERERKKIRATFGHYVSNTVIEEMLKSPERLRLGGEEKVLTVLFSDLAGFTTYSERLRPNEMVNILSDYFKDMTEQVFAHNGTLKEYVADEMMAIFGAPLERSDHAILACGAALGMRDRLRRLREEWPKIGRPALRARTGVNSGPMLVGNLGSPYRFAYGVLGDHVNLGSRLEGLNKTYSTEILIGENTAELVGDSFMLREVDMVRVKGRVQPVHVYELVAKAGDVLPEKQLDAFSSYKKGLEAYRDQRWTEALAHFEKALSLWPEDGPSKVMAERCRIYLETPPEGEWDGVFQQLTK